MEHINIKDCIIETKNDIRKILDILIYDEWIVCKDNVYKIVNNLNMIFKVLVSNFGEEKYININKKWIDIINALLKAIKMEDTIQLADLFAVDILELFDNAIELVGD